MVARINTAFKKMKKIAIYYVIGFVILAIIVSIIINFKDILRIQKEIKYYSNRERVCDHRAELLRIRVGNVLFKIPADIFNRDSLKHCWGGSGVGPHWGCVEGQKIKTFKNSSGEEVKGFCQKESDSPFRIDILDLDFKKLNSTGLILNLKANNQPDLTVSIDKIRIHEYKYYFVREYCMGFRSKNSLRAAEKNEINMFENPVYLEWYSNEKKSFFFKSLLSDEVWMWPLDPFVQNLKDIPKDYWPSYFTQIENQIKKYTTHKFKPEFEKVCSKFLEGE